jgi:hypothetical protein
VRKEAEKTTGTSGVTFDEMQEFINSLLSSNEQLGKDKDVLEIPLQITTALIARNTRGGDAQQWTPEQQLYIADIIARNASQNNSAQTSSSPTDEIERQLAELLSKNAELTYKQTPLEGRRQYIADLKAFHSRLLDEKGRIDGQQRVLAELITSTMGLSNTGASPARNDAYVDTDIQAEYEELLLRAQKLWSVIQ